MLPFLRIELVYRDLWLPTNDLLIALSVLVALGYLAASLRSELSLLRLLAVVLGVASSAYLGARVFHAAWERPAHFLAHPLAHPLELFTHFDGMTFYGALPFGLLALLGVSRFAVPFGARRALFDRVAIAAAFVVGILRIGCFANGCCWGKLAALPWSVRYFDENSVMPLLGLPVHPVQLYDAALGFGIAGILSLFRSRFQGRLIAGFLLIYASGRFFTEFFRGDSGRGDAVLWELSTSQVISIVIVGSWWVWKAWCWIRDLRVLRPAIPFLLLALFSAGCGKLPQPPGNDVISARGVLREAPGGLEVVRLQGARHADRNLIYVALDDVIQTSFGERIARLYPKRPGLRLEEIAWWMHVRKMVGLYDQVVRIGHDRFSRETLFVALEYMESLGRPYDLVLLTHGIPNHIKTTQGHELLSWKDLAELKGKLRGLNLVFMQSCFGSTLAPDWQEAGAKAVISFPKLNRNFFYFDFFLVDYKRERFDVMAAYEQTNRTVHSRLRKHRLYRQVVTEMEMTMEEYIDEAPHPVLGMDLRLPKRGVECPKPYCPG